MCELLKGGSKIQAKQIAKGSLFVDFWFISSALDTEANVADPNCSDCLPAATPWESFPALWIKGIGGTPFGHSTRKYCRYGTIGCWQYVPVQYRSQKNIVSTINIAMYRTLPYSLCRRFIAVEVAAFRKEGNRTS